MRAAADPRRPVGVGSFYDMLNMRPAGRNSIYVCTNISCSLNGAHELFAAFHEQAGDDPDFQVKSFECLGACDIAPMASVNDQYVGPIEVAEVPTLLQQLRDGDEPLPAKQIARRASVDPKARGGAS